MPTGTGGAKTGKAAAEVLSQPSSARPSVAGANSNRGHRPLLATFTWLNFAGHPRHWRDIHAHRLL